MTSKSYFRAVAIAVALTAIATVPAFAQTNNDTQNNAPQQGQAGQRTDTWQGRGPGMMGARGANGIPPGIMGSVSSINGTTLVVASRGFGTNAATTSYTVNAANATVMKNNATSTLSSVAVGDKVFVQGTISGTSVTATAIRDGLGMRGRGPGGPGFMASSTAERGQGQDKTLPIKGNGQPVVAGTVSSISGSSVVITTLSSITYTIDASNATVDRNGSASTVSAIVVGDYIVAQGAVNGTSVTASSIIDNQARSKPASGTTGTGMRPQGGNQGFFGSIGGWFKNLFGF